MNTVLRTPDLKRSLADYTGVLGFTCRQHIPGVLTLLDHGPLTLQIWGCGAEPGRWEKSDRPARAFAPEHHSAAVNHIHALHASLRRAALRVSPASALRVDADGPRLQPWGAWEFAFQDIDGNVLHCVDWCLTARSLANPLPNTDGQGDAL